MKHVLLGAAALASAVLASEAASAATAFTINGLEQSALPDNYGVGPNTPADTAPGTLVRRNSTLGVTGPAKATFTYLGSEARYRNVFQVNGTTYFDNKAASNPSFTLNVGAGNLSFAFATLNPAGTFNNGGTAGYHGSVALFLKSPTVLYALFNDVALVDKDYDDLVVRVDLAPIPLPAAAWLLVGGLGGLGGLGALGRRKPA